MDAESLRRNNLVYREPAAYDELMSDGMVSDRIIEFAAAAKHGEVRTVLDLGCGTARVLADLNSRCHWSGTGVDIQPGLTAWASRQYPNLRLVSGDLRTVRLRETFDMVVCVGNTFAYLHSLAELAAAFATIAAHCRPGTLVAVATLVGAGRDASGRSEITTSLGRSMVDAVSVWDSRTSILTSTRTWRFPDGRVEQDSMRRRFWHREALSDQAESAGFDVFDGDGCPELTLRAVRRG